MQPGQEPHRRGLGQLAIEVPAIDLALQPDVRPRLNLKVAPFVVYVMVTDSCDEIGRSALGKTCAC